MRLGLALLLVLVLAVPAAAQTASAPACAARAGDLGGIGRATVVSFTGPVFGGAVCAVVANLAGDAFTARVADAPSADALVVAALSGGGDVTVPLDGAVVTSAGPYVVAPGGVIPSFGADTSEAPRVVLAYAGARVLVIATSAVSLVDLARVLRTQPALFGSDAVERAVVLASGAGAALSLRAADGVLGSPDVRAPRVLLLTKRG